MRLGDESPPNHPAIYGNVLLRGPIGKHKIGVEENEANINAYKIVYSAVDGKTENAWK